MCYIEAIKTTAINNKFTRITNPTVSIYFSILLTILEKVKQKRKYDMQSGLFTLDRKYIFNEVGIDTTEQKHCDEILFRLGIVTKIDPANSDCIAIDMKKYFEILTDNSLVPEDLLPKTVKMTAADRKVVKKASIKAGIVKLFSETDPTAIDAVTKLVDVYYDKGNVKHEQWKPIVTMLHACTTDPTGLAEIVDYIIATNYTSIPAAIDSFMKKHAGNATKLGTKQKVCTGVSDITF